MIIALAGRHHGVAGFFRLLRAYPWKAPYEVQAEEVGVGLAHI